MAVTPGKALLLSLLPLLLQGQRCMSGLAVRILEVVASPVRILETPPRGAVLPRAVQWYRARCSPTARGVVLPRAV